MDSDKKMCPWPWGKEGRHEKRKKKEPKTINIFFGFFFCINFCVGSGFLGIPYSFFYSGYLAAIPTLLFIGLINWINANYLLEIMARAQASSHQPAGFSQSENYMHENKKNKPSGQTSHANIILSHVARFPDCAYCMELT